MLLVFIILQRRRRRRKQRELLINAPAVRGSRPGRMWKKPRLQVGEAMKLYFRPGCSSTSSGDEEGQVPMRRRTIVAPAEFRNQFRCSRRMFMFLLRGLRSRLQHDIRCPPGRLPVTPREAIALALSRLGTKGEGWRSAQYFGRATSTGAKWTDRVCKVESLSQCTFHFSCYYN